MTWLHALIINGFLMLAGALSELWHVVREFLTTKWAAFILAVGVIWTVLSQGVALGQKILLILTNIVVSGFDLAPSGQILNVLAIANTFFPLDQLCVYTVAYGILVLAMTVYRFAKSMIPSPVPGGGGT
jgi:thiol:disulfide interchange protein